MESRAAAEAEIVRKCLARKDNQVRAWPSLRRPKNVTGARAATLADGSLSAVRSVLQCSFFEHQGKKIMYRRYASLFFIVGTEDEVRRRAFTPARRTVPRLLLPALSCRHQANWRAALGVLYFAGWWGRSACSQPFVGTRLARLSGACWPDAGAAQAQPQTTQAGTSLTGWLLCVCPLSQNELAILEFIHSFVETLDRYFENVCELDIMKNLEAVHFMLNEMVMNGCIVETNKQNIMAPIMLMDKYTAKGR